MAVAGRARYMKKPLSDRDVFVSLIADLLSAGGVTKRDLASKYQVAVSTVAKWSEGRNLPHPHVRQRIIEDLKRPHDR